MSDKGQEDSREENGSGGAIKVLRPSLFESKSVAQMQGEYRISEPYRHLVIPHLMDSEVLKTACEELKTNMQATLKETDIFKVYQTGDLANMDGLPDESKRLLPSLFAVRDGLYSLEFRRLVQSLTGSGPLSGQQIDLSANAFGHTGHLLCHDDVIGTRKVSYILYLVDEDWGSGEKPDGGGLQLYPLETDGVPGIPAYAPSKTIPPRWNQMVLFAVQPGRSFHDVQEVYNEHKPRLAVSGWFHGALESEMGDWPGHAFDPGSGSKGGDADGNKGGGEAASTLEQLKGAAGGGTEDGGGDGDGSSLGAPFTDDFVGTEDLHELAEWVNPEYLNPSMVDQCAAAFDENGSTFELHRFLKDDIAQKIVDAAIAADRKDGLGYMEASPFDAGVRGGWRKEGPPHRQRMLRLSTAAEQGAGDGQDDEIGALLRALRDKLFRSEAFKALLQTILGDATTVVASRRQARRFRPGLDYTLATPGAPWEWNKSGDSAKGAGSGKGDDGCAEGVGGTHENDVAREKQESGGVEEGVTGEQYMVLDAVLCFVDDREPYKEAAWRQDEVGGYVTYLGGDEDELGGSENGDRVPPPQDGLEGGSGGDASKGAAKPSPDADAIGTDGGDDGNSGGGGAGAQKNDAAVYKADEGGSLVSVSAASNALSLVLRDDAGISSFVKYVSSAAPGSRFDVVGEYLVVCNEDVDDDDDDESDAEGDSSSSDGSYGVPGAGLLETVPEGESGEEEEEEEEDGRSRKKMKPSSNGA
ncbi:unnamed protein product [Scytosiphon promiscuus]